MVHVALLAHAAPPALVVSLDLEESRAAPAFEV